MTEEVYKEYLRKAASYCAYQERTQAEVRERLRQWEIYGEHAELIIGRLIEENFLNEERFAKAFAGGKFRVKHWGKQKIKYELKQRGLSEYNIRIGLNEIEGDDYETALKALILKKKSDFKGEKTTILKLKVAKFAISKGFESNLVWQILNESD